MTHMRYKFSNDVVISVVSTNYLDMPFEAWVIEGSDEIIESLDLGDILPEQPKQYSNEEMARMLHLWCYYMNLVSMEVI